MTIKHEISNAQLNALILYIINMKHTHALNNCFHTLVNQLYKQINYLYK